MRLFILVLSVKWWLGPLLLLGLCVIIALAFLIYSENWNRQEKLATRIRKNARLIERDVPIRFSNVSPFNDEYGLWHWKDVDLFLVPEGILIRGIQNSDGFYQYIFLYRSANGRKAYAGCHLSGQWVTPAVNDGIEFTALLSFAMGGSFYCTIHLSINDATLREFRLQGLIA